MLSFLLASPLGGDRSASVSRLSSVFSPPHILHQQAVCLGNDSRIRRGSAQVFEGRVHKLTADPQSTRRTLVRMGPLSER